MQNKMTKQQFTDFLKSIDMKKCEFAEENRIKPDSVIQFTRETRKKAEALAERLGYDYETD